MMWWWVKLNQWKIWKTEPTENLHQPLYTFKCRKVIRYECPHIKVLRIETSSCLNVETEPGMKWCSDGEPRPIENGCHFVNMCHKENFQSTEAPQSLGLWLSECWNHWGSVICNLLYDDFSQNGGNFSIMTDAKFPFTSGLGKAETQTLGGSVIWNFTVGWFFMQWGHFILHHSRMMTFLHLKVQNGQCKFSVGSVSHHHTTVS